MHIPVEALGYQNYNGRWYVRGETMMVLNESDVADLEAMNLGKRRPLPLAEKSRDMSPETEAVALPVSSEDTAKATPAPLPKRGQYVTRAARKR